MATEEAASPRKEGVRRMSVEIHSRKRQLRLSLASLPKTAITKAAISLRRVKVNRNSTLHLAFFLLKVGALEIVRRGAQQTCPRLWWVLQGIPLLHAPPLAWLRRWAPFRLLMRGTQVFSKPVVFLSIASALSNAVEHRSGGGVGAAASSLRAASPTSEGQEEQGVAQPQPADGEGGAMLRRELEQQGILVPASMGNEELQRFFVAANGNTRSFATLVKRSLRWRQNFCFLSSRELEEWSHLVYWHNCDSQGRPLLIIRLGMAASSLLSSQRPRFVQAIVSHIEYGVVNLLNPDDPRLTVVLDCAGAPSVGFPLHMTKSCCVLVQDNYPNRLAALFIVKLPPLVRVVANAIVQILKPATRQKIYIESDESSTRMLAEHLGGIDWVPVYLGGACKCNLCNDARRFQQRGGEQLQLQLRRQGDEADAGLAFGDDSYQTCTGLLRVSIVALLMLWIILALVAGLYDPQLESLPT